MLTINLRWAMRIKRVCISLTIALALLMTACSSNNDTTTVKDGTYVLKQAGTEEVILPCINISDDDISFTYDFLSSYLPTGTYTIEDDVLTMKTNDGKYKYVFKVDEDKLIFQKNESSKVDLIDDRLGVKVTDNAEFFLKEK